MLLPFFLVTNEPTDHFTSSQKDLTELTIELFSGDIIILDAILLFAFRLITLQAVLSFLASIFSFYFIFKSVFLMTFIVGQLRECKGTERKELSVI